MNASPKSQGQGQTIWRLSSRLDVIQPSLTLAVTAKAGALRRQGIDIIGFGAGEPDFDTPDHIKTAAKQALDAGATKYTDVPGTPELRRGVADWLNQAHALTGEAAYAPENIIVSSGAKHSLFNLFQALIDPGDEVVVPAPYWVSYPDLVRIAGGEAKILETTVDAGFLFTGDELEASLTPKTRAVVLVSPSNPTGAVATAKHLAGIAEVCLRRNLIVVCDDIYRSLIYPGSGYQHLLSVAPEMRNNVVLVDGVSKAYAMTGWRIGFCAAPKSVVSAMIVIQGQSTSNATTVSQSAALAAISGPQDCISMMRDEFDKRRRVMVAKLSAMPGVHCPEPFGAFYAFPDVRGCLGKKTAAGKALATDMDLADYLLEQGRVAVVPGVGFGAPGFVRLSYATSMKNIETGLERMHQAIAELR